MTTVMSWLARRRVTLGFVTAVAAAILSQPTSTSWSLGLAVALAGEAIRVWAAGHLEKGSEVTRSGPYRLTRHPLYLGSSLIALGVVIASSSVVVAVLAAVYMGSTITAAIRTEEAYLRQAFGDTYDRYARSSVRRSREPRQAVAGGADRRFSLDRAWRNREYRAVMGVAAGFAFLALRIVLSL